METLHDKYCNILARNGITDKIQDVEIFDSGAKGDGFSSVTKRVKVTFEDNGKAPLNLFIKQHTDNPSHEQFLSDLKAFEKEAEFFMKYLPEARKLCSDNGFPQVVDFYPKCYFGDDQLIVLEDLVADRGLEMLPNNRHDFATATFALNNLAKHHAISFAMIEEAGGADNFFKKFPNLLHDSYGAIAKSPMLENFQSPLPTTVSILEKHETTGRDEALAMVKSFAEKKYSDLIRDSWQFAHPSEALMLLNHGDYKFNNMLFRIQKETEAVLEHVPIDMQVIRYDSPAFDLGLYLFSSVDHTVRQTRIRELITDYLNTLNGVSKDLGHPTDLSFEDLWAQYRKQFKIGYWGALVTVGPGMEILKNIDIDKNDINWMSEYLRVAMDDWLKEHPEKGLSMAEEIVGLVNEYNTLLN